MSKTLTRAAARAFRDERRKRESDELHKKNVRVEMEVLAVFRDYMQSKRPTETKLGCLIGAIDAYAEQLLGDKDALWSRTEPTRSAGGKSKGYWPVLTLGKSRFQYRSDLFSISVEYPTLWRIGDGHESIHLLRRYV